MDLNLRFSVPGPSSCDRKEWKYGTEQSETPHLLEREVAGLDATRVLEGWELQLPRDL